MRLAILNRHFWPVSGSAEMEVAYLTQSLLEHSRKEHSRNSQLRCSVDIVTVRSQKHWPACSVYRGATIHRIAKPPVGPFGRYRATRLLTSHLVQQNYDAIIAFGLDDDTCTAASVTGDRAPLVLRVTGQHLAYPQKPNSRQMEAVSMAGSIFTDSETTRRQFCERFDNVAGKTFVLPPLIAPVFASEDAPIRSLNRQSTSRIALSDAHPILQIEPQKPLVVTCTSQDDQSGLRDLVIAWKPIQRAWPLARLWIIGAGTETGKIWDEIVEQELVYTAIMPGFFDSLEEVFKAADLYVHPTHCEVTCSLLQSARASGLCSIATADQQVLSHLAGDQGSPSPFQHDPSQGLLVKRHSPTDLTATIEHALRHFDFRTRIGNQTRQHVADANTQEQIVERWLDSVVRDNATQ